MLRRGLQPPQRLLPHSEPLADLDGAPGAAWACTAGSPGAAAASPFSAGAQACDAAPPRPCEIYMPACQEPNNSFPFKSHSRDPSPSSLRPATLAAAHSPGVADHQQQPAGQCTQAHWQCTSCIVQSRCPTPYCLNCMHSLQAHGSCGPGKRRG